MLTRFGKSRSGNFAAIAALAILPMVATAGLAVDYSVAMSAKNSLQSAADAGALAAAKLSKSKVSGANQAAIAETVREFFGPNTEAAGAVVKVATDPAAATVTVAASLDQKLYSS